jgi:hypothetical protein
MDEWRCTCTTILHTSYFLIFWKLCLIGFFNNKSIIFIVIHRYRFYIYVFYFINLNLFFWLGVPIFHQILKWVHGQKRLRTLVLGRFTYLRHVYRTNKEQSVVFVQGCWHLLLSLGRYRRMIQFNSDLSPYICRYSIAILFRKYSHFLV